MRTKRFSETEFTYAVMQLEMGLWVKAIARRHGAARTPCTGGAGSTTG